MEEVRAPLAPDAERSVRTAVIGNFVDIFGLCTILPLIPVFVKDVGAPKIWVGLISGAQFLGCCLGNFTWGQVGDRRDPNAVALGLMVGDAVFFALTAACTDAPSLCAVRVLTGFCAFWVLGETLISKVVPGPRVAEYKAKYLGGALLGQIFGPVNGGLLGTLGWAYPCYVAAAAAAAAAARLACGAARRRPRPRPRRPRTTTPATARAETARGTRRRRNRRRVRVGSRDRAAKLATVFGHAHYRAAVFVYCAVGLTFNGVNTVLYVTLAYRYGLREWQVGLFGLGLCFALMLSLSFYETWERTFGVYGMLAVFGPAGVALYGLLAAFGKASLGAFSCLFFASVVVFGPLFNTATMVITNVARTWAPGAEGTALSYASLLHNAAQAAGCVEINRWNTPSSNYFKPLELGRGSRALRLVPDGARWRAPWLAAAAATLAFVAAPLAVRVAVPLPPDTFMPARAFEVRRRRAAARRRPRRGGAPSTRRRRRAPRRRRAGRRGAPRRRGAGRRGALVAEPADGATTV
ncbi:major facilitator superfamily-like protein [Aureococcus anophagefferens]|nr:major facilitator superfamily-like protein [Aureococcus anophagefferens]